MKNDQIEYLDASKVDFLKVVSNSGYITEVESILHYLVKSLIFDVVMYILLELDPGNHKPSE